MSYKEFSYYYDYFNYYTDYNKIFSVTDNLIKKYGNGGNILCDLGCGTGEMAIRFADNGYDVIAVDSSIYMLDAFRDKLDIKLNKDILIIQQDITKLDLFGTVDIFTCTSDTVNHLGGDRSVKRFFNRISMFLDPKGVFIFDMNTIYKHKNILKNKTFTFDEKEAKCIWKNVNEEDKCRTQITINIIDKISNEKYSETFYEYYYSLEKIKEMLFDSNLEIVCIVDGEKYTDINNKTERYLFVVKKKQVV